MPAILKHAQRVFAAGAFVDTIDLGASNPYMAIAKQSAWADENNPPTPSDNIDTDTQFWTDLIGVAEIDAQNTIAVVPNNTWTSGTTYQIFDESSITAFAEPFYVVNSEGRVYECTVAGGGASTDEPLGAGQFVGADGYTWDYLYELTANELQNLTTENWLPVHAAHAGTLGANNVLIYKKLADPTTTGGKLPAVQYRQVAILIDPLDNVGASFTGAYGDPADMEATLTRGKLIQLDNRKVISRTDGQTEEIIAVVTF